MVLGAVTGTAYGPNTLVIAAASIRSSSGSAAASAKTTSTSSGTVPASASASSMTRCTAGPRPLHGGGSKVEAWPVISP